MGIQILQKLAAELRLKNVTVGKRIKLKNYKILDKHRQRLAAKTAAKKKKTFEEILRKLISEASAKPARFPK